MSSSRSLSYAQLASPKHCTIECHHGEKKPHKFLQTLKPRFGCDLIEADVPSRNKYRRASDPARGFKGEEVHGIQAEYLDEEDMAWGKGSRKSKKQA